MSVILKYPYTIEEAQQFHIEHNGDLIEYIDGDLVAKEINLIEIDENLLNRQKFDSLFLTPADVERALYYSDLHMDFDDLKSYIAQKAPQIDLKGLAIEFRANNFYRGAVDKDGNRIIDIIGALLGYSSDDMDYLFINKQLPTKE